MTDIVGHSPLNPDGSILVYLGEEVVIDVVLEDETLEGRSFVIRIIDRSGTILGQAASSLVMLGAQLVARFDLSDQVAGVIGDHFSADAHWVLHETFISGYRDTPFAPLDFSVRRLDDPSAALPAPPTSAPTTGGGLVSIRRSGSSQSIVIRNVGPIGAPHAWILASASMTAQAGDRIRADTSAESFAIQLPAAPGPGAEVWLADDQGAFGDNPVTVGRNGQTIMGAGDDLVLDTAGALVVFVFSAGTWKVSV